VQRDVVTMTKADAAVVAVPGPVERRARVAGAVAGAVTFLAYLPGLGRSLDFDSAETVGLFIRPGPPWTAFREQAIFNNHPMFSFLEQLVRVVTGGAGAATMRLLPIVFGAVAVGVLTWFAACRQGLLAGIVAGAVVACNPTFVDLSRAVRGYSLLTLCAIVTTIVVAEDRRSRPRRGDLLYILVAGVGLATHLYMVPVLVAHLGAVVARKRLDVHWRTRFVGALVMGALAYAGMAATMVDAARAHDRVFQADMPWRVATMATGGGWASLLLAPLVVVGAVIVLRASRAALGAAVALVAVLVGLWAVMQSSALDERFLVWLVPGGAYLVAVAVSVARLRRLGYLLAAGSAGLALATVVPGYTSEPTAYRQAAAVLRSVDAAGDRGCVVGVGVRPMLGYLDSPADFATVTDAAGLDQCDTVVVATWWPTTAAWFAADRLVIDAAERRFPHRLVLEAADPALVLSRRPVTPSPATSARRATSPGRTRTVEVCPGIAPRGCSGDTSMMTVTGAFRPGA